MEYCDSINVNPETKRETLHHISLDFPYNADICDLHMFPGNVFPWHWHRELEIFYMREGTLEYHLPGGVTTFTQGQGGFLNTNILHKTTCKQDDACIQEEQQFSPEFIGGQENSLIMRKYVQPILSSPDISLVKFDPDIPEHRPILNALCRCYGLYAEKSEGYELALQQQMLLFWKELYDLTRVWQKTQNAPVDDHRIKQMLAFIAEHYGEPLQLEDIAAAAYMSPRACGRCFQAKLGTTPFAYLMDYRTQRAGELLVSTTLPVSEISSRCGFCSSSYFGRIFREKTGVTPNQYRKQHSKPS